MPLSVPMESTKQLQEARFVVVVHHSAWHRSQATLAALRRRQDCIGGSEDGVDPPKLVVVHIFAFATSKSPQKKTPKGKQAHSGSRKPESMFADASHIACVWGGNCLFLRVDLKGHPMKHHQFLG